MCRTSGPLVEVGRVTFSVVAMYDAVVVNSNFKVQQLSCWLAYFWGEALQTVTRHRWSELVNCDVILSVATGSVARLFDWISTITIGKYFVQS